MTTSQISAAGAYAQAERLVVTIPVRPIDPTRRRFQLDDQSAQQARTDSQSQADATPDAATDVAAAASDDTAASTGGAAGSGRTGGGLLGAFTSFLARIFAQGGEDLTAATASGAAQAGAQAYARAATITDVGNYNGVELVSPSFPRLASGRAVDLSV